jgi:hypothetical protein
MSPLIARRIISYEPPIPEGVYTATCTGVIDLGTPYNTKYDKPYRELLIFGELPAIRRRYERDGIMVDLPRQISRQYTLSLSPEENLYYDLIGWRGREFTQEEKLYGFDLFSILGKSCQLQVVHNKFGGQTYANVAKVMALPAVVVPPAPENPLLRFSFDDESPEIPEQAPSKVKAMIEECPEWMALNRSAGFELPNEELEPVAVPDDEDHIPF